MAPLLMRAFVVLQALVGATIAFPFGAPTVKLDDATFTGERIAGVNRFLGIPFAQPPVGSLRFRLPQPVEPYTGSYQATSYGPSCPQQKIGLPILDGLAKEAADYVVNSVYGGLFPDDEDCLTINVITPASATSTSNLPVVVWIFGGGFEIGGVTLYDGGNVVSRSIELRTPVIYVSMNYRLSGFGFLASQEVKEAGVGNLGLQDQREALRWVQKNIKAFGGDPTKVTIWGESAGAISVALQMVTNEGNTEGLFRGAFMESGSVIPIGDILHGQKYFDAIVEQTGCSSDSDKLDCLRTVPYDDLKAAIDDTPGLFDYQSLNLAWIPRADGVFFTDAPQRLVQQGKVANIPFVNGDCDDEGTLFSLSTLNVTTETQFKQYVKTQFFPLASDSDLNKIASLYPRDITKGSPYNTSILNALTPQFKRLASFFGDSVFQAPRKFLLRELSGRQNTWSFLSKRFKSLSVFGSVHASDILNVYGVGEMRDFLIHFTVRLDPNPPITLLPWPKYTTRSPKMMTFLDGLIPLTLSNDNYRVDAMNFLIDISLENPL